MHTFLFGNSTQVFFTCDCCQVSGLFRISSSTDYDVTMIPLSDIPGSLSTTPDGSIVITFADTRSIQVVSSVDGSVINHIQIGTIEQPLSAMPVNGVDNGYLVCSETDEGLAWYICGHRLEEAASSLEEPFHLRSFRNISGLIPDPFGSYVAFSTTQNSVSLFDSTFAFLRQLFSGSDGVDQPMALGVSTANGHMAVGQRNGVIKLYQLLRTRETVEIGICS